MSSEEQKMKRSQRRANTHTKIKKQVRIAKLAGVNIKDEHRYAKHHALDCGVPRCPVCDGAHTPKRVRTPKEIKSIQELRFIDLEKTK
jgi:hypothetical protein